MEEHVPAVERVFEVSVVSSWEKVEDGHDPQEHMCHTEQAFPCDDANGRHLYLLQEELLANNLTRLASKMMTGSPKKQEKQREHLKNPGVSLFFGTAAVDETTSLTCMTCPMTMITTPNSWSCWLLALGSL